MKFAYCYGGNKYYDLYLKMAPISISSPAFADEAEVRYLVKEVLLGARNSDLKSGFTYL